MSRDPDRTDPSMPTLEYALRDRLEAMRRQQTELFAEMQHNQQRLRLLARSVWRVQEDERRALARELHDGVGQNLTALKHLLERGEAGGVERALALCAQTLEEVRALSRALRPQILDDLGLVPALEWLARTMAQSGGFAIRVEFDRLELKNDLATLLYRLAQEALTNVVKHARCQHVMLRLAARGKDVHLIIADDGVGTGFQNVGTGLGSMRERVALFGGQLHLTSEPGAGMQLRAVLPLEEA